ncbi:transcriptional regulator, AraC family, putative [Pseudovibrio sp. JE062]|nr:transcriptional regulator, AraC family, putative [Pseudovibrio sp. JE062]
MKSQGAFLVQIAQQIRVKVLDETMEHHAHDSLVELSPIFQIFIYLEGQQQFYIDDVYFDLDAGSRDAPKPQALLFNLKKSANLRLRPSEAGHSLRKVGIAAQPDWFGSLGLESPALSEELRSFMNGQLNYFIWQPDEQMVECAARVLSMSSENCDEIGGLQRQAEALGLLAQTCAHLRGAVQAEAQEDDTKLRIKGLKVREYLLEHLGEDLSIERISKETGLSKRSIQRHFKEKYNLTVSDFIRKQRLEKARQAINKGGITVAEAAYMAGYNSPSSFSNAFKRVYGSAPKNWRA